MAGEPNESSSPGPVTAPGRDPADPRTDPADPRTDPADPQADPADSRAQGSTSRAEGSTSRAEGSTSRAEGSTSRAQGSAESSEGLGGPASPGGRDSAESSGAADTPPGSGPGSGPGSEAEEPSAGAEVEEPFAGAEEPSAGATADPGPLVTETVSAPGPDGEPMRATRQVGAITQDTARPEGGGRAAAADAPAPARQWPIIAVLATTGAGLLITGLGAFRVGTLLIGLALILGAVLRWSLPSVGMLAVRSRFTDMLTYGLLGVVIVLLALMVQPHPWLKIPFLDEVLHFTLD